MFDEADGGYDAGYAACPCFWGKEPGSLVSRLLGLVGSVRGWKALDVGCGEGKNAVFLARHGASVLATDTSQLALRNAELAWGTTSGVEWRQSDVRTAVLEEAAYDLVVAYGLLHCLRNEPEIASVVRTLQGATRRGGYNLVCAFNSRAQDLSAHPGFEPTLLSHAQYLSLYKGWDILAESDSDLHETHPHNQIPHVHSMTRIIAKR